MAAETEDIETSYRDFMPILTVMVDYGNAPFLWLVDVPDRTSVWGNVEEAIGTGLAGS